MMERPDPIAAVKAALPGADEPTPPKPTLKPTRKITSAAVGYAASAIALWLLGLAFPHLSVPPDIPGAIAVIIGYLVPEPPQ